MNYIFRNNLLCLIAFLLFLLTSAVSAQEHMGKGRISGTVVDQNGTPIEGVLIVVESVEFQTKRQSHSDDKGHFALAGMRSGLFRFTASKNGYNSGYTDVNIQQLRRNPPIILTLEKMKGYAALMADEDSWTLFDKGNLMIKEEKYDEALGIFEEFLEKYPTIYQVHLNIGTCFLKKGDLEKAEAEFKLVLDKTRETLGDYIQDPQTCLRAFSGLGEIYLQKEDFETAQKYFAQALQISPEDEVAAYNVGEVFFSNQKIDDSIKYFELATQIKKDWSKPCVKLGYVYLNKGDFDKSLEYFNKFVEMDPENPEVPQVKNIIATIEKMKK